MNAKRLLTQTFLVTCFLVAINSCNKHGDEKLPINSDNSELSQIVLENKLWFEKNKKLQVKSAQTTSEQNTDSALTKNLNWNSAKFFKTEILITVEVPIKPDEYESQLKNEQGLKLNSSLVN